MGDLESFKLIGAEGKSSLHKFGFILSLNFLNGVCRSLRCNLTHSISNNKSEIATICVL